MADNKTRPRTQDGGQPHSREEARRRHKKRARRVMWRRLIAVVAIFVGVWVIRSNWDSLAPDKLLANMQDAIGDASGSYPVDVSGTDVHSMARSQNYTVLLSDSYLTYYNEQGGEVTRYPCTYSSALMRTAGKYVLVAEQNGKRLLLSTRSMALWDATLEHKILSASVNEKVQIAVLTQGTQGYAVELIVYDRKGTELYRRSRVSLAGEVTLSSDGKTVALLSVDAQGGVFNTVVEAFSLSSTDPQAMLSYTAADTLLYRLEFLSKNRLLAVGERGVLIIPTNGDDPNEITTDGQQVLGYAKAQDSVALILRPLGSTDGGTVKVLNAAGEEWSHVAFNGEFRHLSAEGRHFLLLTDTTAQVIDKNGAGKSADVEADGQQAVLYGNNAVVLGLSTLQQYPLS